jgi:hypothetical protein
MKSPWSAILDQRIALSVRNIDAGGERSRGDTSAACGNDLEPKLARDLQKSWIIELRCDPAGGSTSN